MKKRVVLFVFIEVKWNIKGPILQQMKNSSKLKLKLEISSDSQFTGRWSSQFWEFFFIFHCSKTKQVPWNLLTEILESATPNLMLSFTSHETESSWSEEQRDNFPRRKRINRHCPLAMFLNFRPHYLICKIVFGNLAIDQSSQLNKI